jgi:hypothetical protein
VNHVCQQRQCVAEGARLAEQRVHFVQLDAPAHSCWLSVTPPTQQQQDQPLAAAAVCVSAHSNLHSSSFKQTAASDPVVGLSDMHVLTAAGRCAVAVAGCIFAATSGGFKCQKCAGNLVLNKVRTY